jgi:stalled ribosome rescue protein Dom34
MNLGQFHTFKIEINKPLSIFKEYWDQVHFKILNESTEENNEDEIKVLIMEEG